MAFGSMINKLKVHLSMANVDLLRTHIETKAHSVQWKNTKTQNEMY